jgi:hypothetical protein
MILNYSELFLFFVVLQVPRQIGLVLSTDSQAQHWLRCGIGEGGQGAFGLGCVLQAGIVLRYRAYAPMGRGLSASRQWNQGR